MIELRTVTPDDWPIWRQLRLGALAEAPYAFGSQLADWQGEGDREERWRDRLSLPGSYKLVAVHGGEPAGIASGVPTDDPSVMELISMWVAPTARGRGAGDELLLAVERWARRLGSAVLRLSVAEGNPAATALYHRHGFVYTGELGDLMPDGVRRELVMTKSLHAPVGDEPLSTD
ncbi:MAG: GNAT family N-acetyltransferase [Micromonospora sp.]